MAGIKTGPEHEQGSSGQTRTVLAKVPPSVQPLSVLKTGAMLTVLMLLTAQVPLLACPCPDNGGLHPALADDHDAHHHAHGHTHSHGHCHAKANAPECSMAKGLPHNHDVLNALLVLAGETVEMPTAAACVHVVSAPVLDVRHATWRVEGGATLDPPPDRPPSAACLADAVRLLA